MTFRNSLIIAVVAITSSHATAILPMLSESTNNKVTFRQYNTNSIPTTFSHATQKQIPKIVTADSQYVNSSQYASQYAKSHNINKKVQAFIVRNTNGQESLIPITLSTELDSSDIIEYQGEFTNNGANRIRSMMVALSIPEGMALVGNISPEYALGSSNAQKFYNMPVRSTLNGVLQDLPLSYYRALKWNVKDLGLGKTTIVKYRAKMK